MDNAQTLIRKARALESSGQDEGALGCYLQALAGAGPEPDVNLLARAGVLQLRLGRLEEAAETLARASDLYARGGLRNNALALCHRVLRVDAQHLDFLRRSGELSALQGYQPDARRGLIEYAALIGGTDAPGAAAALRSYLGHFPDDTVVKARLAELTGEEEPSAEPASPAPAANGAAATQAPDDFGILTTLGDEADADEPEPLPVLTTEPTLTARESDPGIVQIEGLEPTMSGERWSDAGGGDTLELMGNAMEPTGPTAPAAEPEPEEDEPLPLLAPEPAGVPVPPPAPVDPAAELRGRIFADPSDLAAHEQLVDLLSRGPGEGLADALEGAHTAFAASGQYVAAADYAERLSTHRPGDSAALQAWAEHAFRSGDRARLIAAYLAVARRFSEGGQTEAARKIYQRVLKLDPGNEQAAEAVGVAAPPAAGPGSDYVDLGAMVLDDEPSTRFQVEAAFPTGDEEEDFREILSAFREQIATGIDAADTASHYDLGIAFKEMGLWDDAVTQLQRALRAGSSPLATLELLGECYHQKGDSETAARMLDRAAKLPGTSAAELAGVHYWLARAHEALGAVAPARESYQHVVAVDPAFRDAAGRLEALGAG